MAGFPRLGKLLTQALFNGVIDRLERANAYQHGRGVVSGFALSAGTGLAVDFAQGVLVGKSCVSVAAASVPVPASSTVYLWLDEDGAVTTTATRTDPGGTYVCLGRATSDGASVTAVSTEGRTYLQEQTDLWHLSHGGGLLIVDSNERNVQLTHLSLPQQATAPDAITNRIGLYAKEDGGEPRLFAVRENGQHERIGLEDAPRWRKVTLSHSAFSAAATSVAITALELPAGAVVHATKIKHSSSFGGGSVSALTISLGISGNATKYGAAFDVFQAPGAAVQQLSATPGIEDHASPTNLLATASATGDNLNQLSSGSVDIWVLYSVAA